MRTAAAAWPRPRDRSLSPEARRISPAEWWGPRFVVALLLIWVAGLGVGIETATRLLTVGGFAAAVAGLRRPVLGMLGVGMLCTLDPIMGPLVMTGGLFRWNTFNYLLAGVALLHAPFLVRRLDPQSRLLLIFIGVLGVGLLWSPEPSYGVHVCLSVFVTFGLLVYFWRTAGDERVWQWIGLINGFLGAVGGLVFYLEGNVLYGMNANAWAYFPLTALFSIFLASVASVASRRRQMLLAMLAIANCGWIFLVGSRGSMLASLFLLPLVFVRIRGAHLKVLLIAGGVLLGSLIVARFHARVASSLTRITLLLDPTTDILYRTSGRSDLAKAGWHIFLQNPVLGTGTGGFAWYWVKIEALAGLSSWNMRASMGAHSGWIRTLAENGIPGILLHAAYVASFAIVGWMRRRRRLFLAGLLVTATLSAAYISSEFGGKGLWFLAAGMTVLLYRRPARPRPSESARRNEPMPLPAVARTG